MTNETQQNSGQMTNNAPFLHPNIIQLRLDTGMIIQNLQQFLAGEIDLPQQKSDGSIEYVKQSTGERMCSQVGVQQITNMVQGLINPSVVQGNYTYEMYLNHIDRIHSSTTRILLLNYRSWQIKYGNLEIVQNFIMDLVETFLSRLIDNEERKSYALSLKSDQASRVETGKGFSLFGGRN